MQRIIIKEARPGMRVTRPIADPRKKGVALINAGEELTVADIGRLHELGIYDFWIEHPELMFFEELQSGKLTQPQQRLVDALQRSCQQILRLGAGAGVDPQRPLFKRHGVVLPELIGGVVRGAAAIPCFAAMAMQHEELLQRSADVCVLAMLMGLELEGYLIRQRPRLNCRQARDVLNLAMGCLFHDVGEMVMPPGQRESQNELLIDPRGGAGDEWKQHTALGYAAVRKYVDPSAATVVLHHHQHFDGSGFGVAQAGELRQRGQGIHIFSRIAMAADVFQHVIFPAGAGLPLPAVTALCQIRQTEMRDWFDPVALETLVALVPPFVPGMVVTLSDRRQALVREVHGAAACQPVVQILRGPGAAAGEPEVLDLAERRGVSVEAVDGVGVERYLTGARETAVLVAA